MIDKKLKKVILSDDATQAQLLLASANKAARVAALNAAAMYGKANVTRVLLDLDVDANAPDDSGEAPLVPAARGGYPEVVRMLLERGARVDALSESKLSGLAEAMVAADSTAFLAVIDLLLAAGASLRPVKSEPPVLHFALSNTRLAGLTKRLLDQGEEPNRMDQLLKCVPLHLAVDAANLHAIQELLAAGADPSIRALKSWHAWSELTPLELARQKKLKKAVALLEAAPAGTNPAPAKSAIRTKTTAKTTSKAKRTTKSKPKAAAKNRAREHR